MHTTPGNCDEADQGYSFDHKLRVAVQKLCARLRLDCVYCKPAPTCHIQVRLIT
jgi:hypothetical protein